MGCISFRRQGVSVTRETRFHCRKMTEGSGCQRTRSPLDIQPGPELHEVKQEPNAHRQITAFISSAGISIYLNHEHNPTTTFMLFFIEHILILAQKNVHKA